MVLTHNKEPLQVVRGVDLQRYQGRWYEIASMPSRFQPKGGKNTTATYTLRPDGTVHVLNETWLDSKRASIEGTAWKVDPQSDEAKLQVLSRTPQISEEVYSELLAHAEKEGYDVSELHKTHQDEASGEALEGEKKVTNDKGTWWLKALLGK